MTCAWIPKLDVIFSSAKLSSFALAGAATSSLASPDVAKQIRLAS